MRITNNSKKARQKALLGMTVAEMVVAAGVGSIVLTFLAAIFMTSVRSFAEVSNYLAMDRTSRSSLDEMTQKIREASDVTSFTANSLALVITDTNGVSSTVTYAWDEANATLSETTTSGTIVNLSGCDYMEFKMYDSNFSQTSDLNAAKVVGVNCKCSRTLISSKLTTEDMQQAQIIMRKRRFHENYRS